VKLYSFLDKKMSLYGPVMMGHNDGQMSRTIVESFRGSKHLVEKYPEDFDLYEVGEFSEQSGVIVSAVRFVSNASVFLSSNGAEHA